MHNEKARSVMLHATAIKICPLELTGDFNKSSLNAVELKMKKPDCNVVSKWEIKIEIPL